MYLRQTKRKNKDGSEVSYYQLAETVYNSAAKRPEARIVHNFGRADEVDVEGLRRLAASILRVCNEPDLGDAPVTRVGDLEMEDDRLYGPVYVADALWEQLGIADILRARMAARGCRVPHDRILFSLMANRLDRPCSKRACHEHWLAEEAWLPEARAFSLGQLYRALDFLLQEAESVERDIFFRVADLFNADVDLVFWDTTSFWCEVDEPDEQDEAWCGQSFPALRRRGHSKEGRDGDPQIVVGLALTRDGLPVRSWVFPGNTVDATTLERVKADLKGWRLNRCVLVGDAGMYSEANLKTLSAGLGRYILAVPMRRHKEVGEQVLTRPGRYREVRPNLEVKQVTVGAGERRTRYFVCRNRDEAAREKAHRERLLEALRAELETLEAGADEHPKRACELLASRRFGRYLKRGPVGRLSVDEARVAAEEKLDGKYVLTTNDDTLSAEDVALGYKSLMLIEGCFARMKTAGLRTRPLFHWTPHRIVGHVKLCVLALLIERAAELRCGDTWRNIWLQLRRIRAVRYTLAGRTIVQTTRPSPEALAYLEKLKISKPKKILSVTDPPRDPSPS